MGEAHLRYVQLDLAVSNFLMQIWGAKSVVNAEAFVTGTCVCALIPNCKDIAHVCMLHPPCIYVLLSQRVYQT